MFVISRKHVPAALAVVGVVLLLLSGVPIPGEDTSVYVHSVTQPGNDTAVQYSESDVTDYENLSESGQQVFDRARRQSEYTVENESPPASDFVYQRDIIGTHPVRYEGEVYGLWTTIRPNPEWMGLLLHLGQLAAGLLGTALVAVSAILALWRRVEW